MKNLSTRRHGRTSIGIWFGTLVAMFMLATFSTSAVAEMINLNQADAETLQYIPGIGPSKAEDMVELRSSTNGFKSMEDLLAVRGIGEKTLETIRRHGALDQGVSSLTEEMRNNPPKRVSGTGAAGEGTSS